MKRYKKLTTTIPTGSGGGIEIDNKMIEHPHGRWVKWKDQKEELFRFTKIWENKIRELEAKGLKCNCDEMFINHAYNWICPAHGYKKR